MNAYITPTNSLASRGYVSKCDIKKRNKGRTKEGKWQRSLGKELCKAEFLTDGK
jgi:hypothetical protein